MEFTNVLDADEGLAKTDIPDNRLFIYLKKLQYIWEYSRDRDYFVFTLVLTHILSASCSSFYVRSEEITIISYLHRYYMET